jgi:hypothetical protein
MASATLLGWLWSSRSGEKSTAEDAEKVQQSVLDPGEQFPDDDDAADDDDGEGHDDSADEHFDDLEAEHDNHEDFRTAGPTKQPTESPEPTRDSKKLGWRSRLWRVLFPDDDDISNYSPTYRYTPILSGIVIPFAILLEIPGLTEHWYIRTDERQIVETQPNPVILDVGLGFSMGCAVIANIALIIRFLEKHVKAMTLTCICFLSIHGERLVNGGQENCAEFVLQTLSTSLRSPSLAWSIVSAMVLPMASRFGSPSAQPQSLLLPTYL